VANVFYLRIRGKSQGPYTLDQLRGFSKRGQLSRLHEVSTDGATWGRASAYPELFASGETAETATADALGLAPDVFTAATEGGGYRVADAASPAGTANRQAPPMQLETWYYTAGGKQCGPVDLATMQRMVASGHVGPNEQVWAEGMPQWQSVQQMPGLMLHAASPGSALNDLGDLSRDIRRGLFPEVEAGKAGEVSTEACRAIAGMRPWILFIAVFWYIVAVIQFGYGVLILSLLNGVAGLFIIIYSVLTGAAATLLVMSFNRFGVVLHTRRQPDLEQGLHSMRRFWLYMGTLLIVLLSVIAIFIMVALAIGSSFAHLPVFLKH